MLKGTVKWFNTKKGYGFIQPDTGEKDVFVHVTALEKTGLRRLFDGQIVNYDTYDDRGRVAAGNISILK
jgi:cold shock protein